MKTRLKRVFISYLDELILGQVVVGLVEYIDGFIGAGRVLEVNLHDSTIFHLEFFTWKSVP